MSCISKYRDLIQGKIVLEDQSDKVIEIFKKKIKQALHAIGKRAVKNAVDITPKVTGTLRRSITYEVNEEEESVIIGTNIEYAPSVEYGSSKNKHPAHMLTRAATESGYRAEYKGILEKIFKRD